MKNVSSLTGLFAIMLTGLMILPLSAAIVLKDADWLAGNPATWVSAVTDIAGNPGISITYDCPTEYTNLITFNPSNKDYSASGTTFEVELENPNDFTIIVQPFAQDGSGWSWHAAWIQIPAGETRLASVTLTEPSLIQIFGIQAATLGPQTLNIIGPITEVWPTVAKYECEKGFIVTGNTAIPPLTNTSPQLVSEANASGGKAVWTNYNGDDRGYFVVVVDAPVAGTYDMLIRYRNYEESAERGDPIQINDNPPMGDIMYPATGTEYADKIVENVVLIEGRNDIKIGTAWGGLRYDYIQFDFAPEPIPTDPSPADGTYIPVYIGAQETGNTLSWQNHSITYPSTGDDITCDVYIGTSEPNELAENYGMTLIEDVVDSVNVVLEANQRYYWMVYAYEPNDPAPTLHKGHLWQFDTLSRIPVAHYEAEDAIIVSENTGPELRTVAGASGGQVVWTNWGGTWLERGYFIFDVTAPETDTYQLTMHYRAGAKNDFIEINGGSAAEYSVPDSSGIFADYTRSINLNKGVNTIAIRCGWGGVEYDYFEINMDDFTATTPNPKMDEVVVVNGNSLSWKKHSLYDLENAADVKCNVYLGTSEPNMVGDDYEIPLIADGTFDSSLPVILEWNHDYYWIVDSIVPVDEVDTLYKGYLWKFTTNDPKPVITLVDSRIVMLNYGNTPSDPMSFHPTVSDLGKPGLSYLWSLTSGPSGETIDSICSDKTILDPAFVFNKAGEHKIKLSVTDGSGNVGEATITVMVLEFYRSLKLEAEDGVILPGEDTQCEVRMEDVASENRIMWSTWITGDRGSFLLTFENTTAGNFDLYIRYRTDHTGTSWEDVSINGGTNIQFIVRPTPTDEYDYIVIKDIPLVAGTNTLELVVGWGGTYYDFFEFPEVKAPIAPFGPTPENWDTIPTNYAEPLSWKFDPNSPGGIINHTVYFGTQDPNMSELGYGGLTKIEAGTNTSIPMPSLAPDMTYHWVVETTDTKVPGVVYVSKPWQFMTLTPCEYWGLAGDVDNDCDVDLDDLALLIGAWLAEGGYDINDFAILSESWTTCIDPVTGEIIPCQ